MIGILPLSLVDIYSDDMYTKIKSLSQCTVASKTNVL